MYFMLGPYTANKDGTITYKGNKIFGPIKDIFSVKIPLEEFEKRVEMLHSLSVSENAQNLIHH